MDSDKYHSDVCQDFLLWFRDNRKGWYVFLNPSGYASVEHVSYGIPQGGGGFDYIAIRPDGVAEWFEIKTHRYPTLSKKQKAFAAKMSNRCQCWVYREGCSEPVEVKKYAI